MVINEERQLRNLDKLDYMSQYLKEDNTLTKQSLLEAQQIRDQSKNEMQQFQTANKVELDDLALQIKQMEALMTQSEQKQQQVEQDNLKLQQVIELGRNNDTNVNQALQDQI